MAILINLPDRQYRDEVFTGEFDIPKNGTSGRFVATLNPTQFGTSDSIIFTVERLVAGVWQPWVSQSPVVGTVSGSLPEPLVMEASYAPDEVGTRGRARAQVIGQLRTPVTIELI